MTSDTAYIETNRSPFKGYGYNLKYSKDNDDYYSSSSTTIIQIGGGNDSDTSSFTENDSDCCPFTDNSDYEPLVIEKRNGNLHVSLYGCVNINNDEDADRFIRIVEKLYELDKNNID